MKSFFSKRALRNFHSIKEYIANEFGAATAGEFQTKLEKLLDSLETFPEMGIMEVPEKTNPSIPITSQTRIYYRLKGKRIIILTLFNLRQDPKKKPYQK